MPPSLGHEVRLRSHMDNIQSMTMIPNPLMYFETDAVLVAWNLFIKVTSQQHHINLQVWRPIEVEVMVKPFRPFQNFYVSHSSFLKRLQRSYQLVGQTYFNSKKLRDQIINLKKKDQFSVKKGDVIGFQYTQFNPLTFDRVSCSSLQQVSMWYKHQQSSKIGLIASFTTKVINLKPASFEFWNIRPKDSESFCRQYSLKAILS